MMSLDTKSKEGTSMEKNEEAPEANTMPKTEAEDSPEKIEKDTAQETTDKEGSDAEGEPKSGSFFRIDSGLLPFPEKLMTLLDGDQVKDAMWWLPDGDAFCLIPVVFAEKVLDKHFQGTKFESFTRKLNRWGFKRVAGQKVPANTIAYYNKSFLKGKPKLLKNMNGGKTKFISAREKRVRAQMKRDRDREQAVLIAAQQQAMFSDPLGGIGGSRGLPSGGMLAQAKLSMAGQNHMRLQSLLASRPMALQQQQAQVHERRMAEQMLAAEQAMVMKQRDELQMRLLNAGMTGFSGMQSPHNSGSGVGGNNGVGMAASNSQQMFAARNNSMNQPQLSDLQSQLRRTSGDGQSDLSADQLLLARQMMAADNHTSMAQRMMQIGSSNGTPGNFNGGGDDPAAKLVRQRMEEDQFLKSKAFMAQQTQCQQQVKGPSSPPQRLAEGAGGVDPQLLQLYLMDQQRKREMSMGNARQA